MPESALLKHRLSVVMLSTFIPASVLNQRFSVFGHFYEAELKPNLSIKCRSVLEIITTDRASEIRDGRRRLPDAVFVLMNPGSSRPLVETIASAKAPLTHATSKALIPAKPDTTQYQVMRVMAKMAWGHARVLNLSDLREAKSGKFAKTYLDLEQNHGFKEHSMFAASRAQELQNELQRKAGAPLVCAWGVSSSLAPLISAAAPILRAAGVCTGLQKPGSPNRYFHPLPTLQVDKEAWVRDICLNLGVDI